jgi:hypothetical protein
MRKHWPKVKLGELLTRNGKTIELQPDRKYREIVVKSLKRLQAETTVKNTGQAATELNAILPAILDRAFKGEL